MSRYVPPALRGKQTPGVEEGKIERDPEKGYGIKEVCNQFDCQPNDASTLNGGERLVFILLFGDQHPQWPPKIFCKSNLHLLSARPDLSVSSDSKSDAHHPPSPDIIGERPKLPTEGVPVFTQDWALQKQGRPPRHAPFSFSGMYIISSIEYLEPRSQELVNMLDVKFKEGRQRSAGSWEQSLSLKWAVVDLRREDSSINPMVPLKVFKTKGVTEMLAEMRLREVHKDRPTKTQKENVKLQNEAAAVQAMDDQKDPVTVEEA